MVSGDAHRCVPGYERTLPKQGGPLDGRHCQQFDQKYKDLTAVDGLNLSIHAGRLPRWASMARENHHPQMLSCLTRPTADAALYGKSIVKIPGGEVHDCGFTPGNSCCPHLTARENLELMAGFRGFSKEKTKARTAECTDQFHLHEITTKGPTSFQAVGNAGSASHGLHFQPRICFWMANVSLTFWPEVIYGYHSFPERKTTVILTTHYMEEAELLSDRIAIMKTATPVDGTSAEIKAKAGTDRFEDLVVCQEATMRMLTF